MKNLVEDVSINNIRSNLVWVMKPMIAKRISKYLNEKRIKVIIMVKRNSIISPKNNKLENREIHFQKDCHKWKKKRKYGKRWLAETSFSAISVCLGNIQLHPDIKA